jgi:hypothetical protein
MISARHGRITPLPAAQHPSKGDHHEDSRTHGYRLWANDRPRMDRIVECHGLLGWRRTPPLQQRRLQVRHVRVVCLAGMVAVAAALSGCGGSSPGDGSSQGDDAFPIAFSVSEALASAKAHGLDWEVGVLQDGAITAGEYEDAYDRYVQCEYDLGYVPGVPKYLDPVSGTRWVSLEPYGGPEDPDKMAEILEQKCDGPLSLIETPYLATTPERMDARLLARFKECLDTKGIAYEGDEVNYNEFTKDLSDAEFASGPHFDCLVEAKQDVYPEAIGVMVGR